MKCVAVPLLLLPRRRRLPKVPPKVTFSTVLVNFVHFPPPTEYSKYSPSPKVKLTLNVIENFYSLSAEKVRYGILVAVTSFQALVSVQSPTETSPASILSLPTRSFMVKL